MGKLVNTDAARLNPCLKEQEQSYACLNKNGFVQSKCETYFDNYNTCKKFWGYVYKDRKAKGVYPFMPEVEQRDKVKEEYIVAMKNQINDKK